MAEGDQAEKNQVASWLGEHGVDLVSVSTGGIVRQAPIPVGPGYQLPHATSVKQATGLPVSAVGMIDDPFQAEQIVALGQADVVLVGRESLRDPNFRGPVVQLRDLRLPAPARRGPRGRVTDGGTPRVVSAGGPGRTAMPRLLSTSTTHGSSRTCPAAGSAS